MIRWNGKTKQTGCHRFVCFSWMHGYNLRCYVNRLQFSRSPTSSLGAVSKLWRALFHRRGFRPTNSRHSKTGNCGPTRGAHGGIRPRISLFFCLSILRGGGHFEESQEIKKRKRKKKTRKKKKGKETINACVSEDRYKLARWRVGADRLSNILRDARFISRRPKEFDAFRNNFMSGLLRVRAGQVIEIFRFRKLWPWRGKIEIVNQFVGKL